MKKGTIVVLTLGALALGVAAGVAGQRYYEKLAFNTPTDSSSGGGSSQGGSSSQSSSDGSIQAAIQDGPKFAAAVGSTKAVVFTVAPSTASDPYIVVASADTSKVTVSAARVKSGASVTLTLKAVFNGTVAITAHPEALASSVVTVSVSVYNSITSLSRDEYGVSDVASPTSTTDLFDRYELDGSDECFAEASSVVAWDAQGKLSFTLGSSDGYHLFALLTAQGRDTSIMPDIAAVPSGYFEIARSTTSHFIQYAKLIATSGVSTSQTLSWTIEDATTTASEIAYVAPTGLSADSTGVQFK